MLLKSVWKLQILKYNYYKKKEGWYGGVEIKKTN